MHPAAVDGTVGGWEDHYAGTGTVDFYGAEVECLGLPRSILDKFQSGNAQRIIPGLTE